MDVGSVEDSFKEKPHWSQNPASLHFHTACKLLGQSWQCAGLGSLEVPWFGNENQLTMVIDYMMQYLLLAWYVLAITLIIYIPDLIQPLISSC